MIIYTLIFTAAHYVGSSGAVAVHTQHDYPSYEACHKAYEIAVRQAEDMRLYSHEGTCLKSEITKGEK